MLTKIKNEFKNLSSKQIKFISILLISILIMTSLNITYYFAYYSQNIAKNEVSVKEEFYPNYQVRNPYSPRGFENLEVVNMVKNQENGENIENGGETNEMEEKSEKGVKVATSQESSIIKLEPSPNYNIPTLTKDEQNYIYTYSKQEDISYDLVLAIFYLETGWTMQPDFITRDVAYGLGQWHKPSGTFDLLRNETVEILGIIADDVQWDNPIHNAVGSIWYINNLYDRWEGYSEEVRTVMTILSYNQGYDGAKEYVKNNDAINHPYVSRVLEIKGEIEKGELF